MSESELVSRQNNYYLSLFRNPNKTKTFLFKRKIYLYRVVVLRMCQRCINTLSQSRIIHGMKRESDICHSQVYSTQILYMPTVNMKRTHIKTGLRSLQVELFLSDRTLRVYYKDGRLLICVDVQDLVKQNKLFCNITPMPKICVFDC